MQLSKRRRFERTCSTARLFLFFTLLNVIATGCTVKLNHDLNVGTSSSGLSSSALSVPVLTYVGASGTIGIVGQSLSITPTSLSNSGSPIISCGLKAGSANSGAFPSTLTIDSATCQITGIPSAVLATTTFILVAVNNMGMSADAPVSIAINPNQPVVSYTGATGILGAVNLAMSVTPTQLTANGAAITSCAIKLGSPNALAFPATLSINSSTCQITGTPTATLSATQFTIVASNSAGPSADALITLTINGGPALSYSGASGTSGVLNQAMMVTPTTLNDNGSPITACGIKSGSPNAGSFPGTLSVNPTTCVISGTPAAPLAATQFTLVASNSAGNSLDALVTLSVSGAPSLSYSGSTGTSGTVNQSMSVTPTTLSANGATITACGIKSGSANAASFPGTLSVNASTCVISGTPTATLTATQFTLVASNSAGNSTDALVTLTINAGVPSLSYSGSTGTTGTVNQAMNISPSTLNTNGGAITACGIKSGSANAGSFPGTLSINSSTCVISGTPTASLAATQFTLVASNSAGNSADALVTLTINAGLPVLSFAGASGTTGTVNQAMSVTPTTLTTNGAAITACAIKSGSANAASFPGTLSINPSTCVITGTPAATLSATQFTLVASNSIGNSADALVTFTINSTVPTLSYSGATGTTGTVNQAMSVSPTTINTNGAAITACGIKSGSPNAASFPGTLSINSSTCVITGTPTATLPATQFTIVASNSAGTSADALVSLTINNVPALSYAGAAGTTGIVNQAMSVSPTTLNTNGAAITACGIKSGSTNAASFPGTLSVNASTCVISGTPTAVLASTQFTIVASNSSGTSLDALVTLAVTNVPILSFSGASGTTGTVNQAMSITPTTLTSNGAAITACGIKSGSPNAGSFPGTLSISATTCTITGTPTAPLAATQFTLVASNSVGPSADALVTLTINSGIPSLSFSSATGTTGTVNQAMSISPTTINANGATITACGIKSGSANAASFPGTLSINASTCVISGTPTATLAATQFTLVASNSAGTSADALVTLTVNAGVPSLSYSGATGTTGTVNQAMSISPTTLNANGATITACGIKSGSANAGSFPGTLSINASTCVISGTPTATLSATQFTIVTSNSAGTSSDALVTLTVNAGIPSLSYSGATGTTGTVNQAMSVSPTTLSANGASITACGIKSGSANAGSFPGTLSINASTCVISGTPTAPLSSTQFTVVASNSVGTSSDALVTLTVNADVPSLSFSGATGTTGTVNQVMSVSPTTINANGATITACGIKSGSPNAASFPGTLSVNASTCVISGTPTASLAATQFTLVAANSVGNSTDALVTLTINNGIPSLSYSGATGTTGTVNQAMSISPTTINANGASITACGIKAGSTNESSFPGTLSINASTCVISGTPTATLSTTQFTIVASNSVGASIDALVTLAVNAGIPSLSYSGATGTTGTVNQAMSVTPTNLNANGATITACGIKSGSSNAASFPGTLSVNASTCVISGTPTASLAATQFTLVASNSAGTSADALVTLTINNGIPSLSYSAATGTTGIVNQAMSVSPTTINGNGASITACGIKSGSANAGSFPGTLSINASTCVISGTPTASLSATQFTIIATNNVGNSADALVTLTINAGVPSLSYSGATGTTSTVNQAMSVSPTTLNANGASITACAIKSGSPNAASFPGTLSINSSTCAITGTPTASLSATQFTIVASNSAGTSLDALVTLTINADVPSLSYSGATGTTGTANQAMSVSPTTLNANGASITACGIKSGSPNAASFPGTLSINSSTCVISGTPTAILSATQFTIVASNSVGTSADALVTLTVNNVPALSYAGAAGTTGIVNQAMSVSPTTLNANGASITSCGIKSGSANAGSFPGTLSINASTCVISGTPTAVLASTQFTIVASNSSGASLDALVTLAVTDVPSLSYSGASGTTGTVNQAMSVTPTTLSANGAAITACGIKSGSANAASFPGTLSINASTCVITGTPTAPLSTTQFTIVASNSVGTSSDALVTLTVNAGVPSLSFSGATGTTGTVNQSMSVSPTTINANGAMITACGIKSGSANAASFPGTLSINASTCVISGTPTAPLAATQFTLVATNSVGNSADALVTLTINAGVPTLSYTGATGTTGTVNQAMSVSPTALNANGATITACGIKSGSANAGSFPGTLSVNASTCVISGTPTAALAATQFTLVASNSAGTSADATVTLTINNGIPTLSYSGATGTTGTVNQAMSVSPTTINGNGASITACEIKSGSTNAGSFPGTLSVNASTCVISGTPTTTLAATQFTLVASNSAGTSTDALVTLTINAGVPSLSYSGATGTTGTVNQAMSVSPTTINANGASITACGIKSGSANAGSFPGTLSVNASTCVISGTPTVSLAATQFTIVASNSAGTSADALVTLTIDNGVPSLSYSGASGTTGSIGYVMSVSPTTINGNGASITACGIKSGSANAASFPGTLSVNASTCVISGTPSATLAATQFTLVASNSVGTSSDALVTLTINNGVPNLSYSGATGTTGAAGTAMSVSPTTLSANGAAVTACGIKSGSANAASFPATLSVNASTCVISGTPTATLAATQFTIVASNSAGTSADALVTLTINAAAPVLSYSGAAGTTVSADHPMLVWPTTLTNNGATITACAIKSGSANAGSFPATLSVNPFNCVIAGIPTAALASTTFTLTAANSAGTSSDATVALQVNAYTPTSTVIASCNTGGSPFGGGTGTAADPYRICTATQLANIGTSTSQFVLTADLDLSSLAAPAGSLSTNAVFDGGNHTLSNFSYSTAGNNVGLFTAASTGSVIKNLILKNFSVTGAQNVGALVGNSLGSTIQDISAIGVSISATTQIAGGLVGLSSGTSYSHCWVSGTSSSSGHYAGGLIAFGSTGTVSDSMASVNVTGVSSNVGGLIGNSGSSTVSRSFSTGNAAVTGGNLAGALVGQCGAGIIQNSFATGNASAAGSWAGGLVGRASTAGGTFTNDYAAGKVSGTTIGGLIGDVVSGTITSSYYLGSSNSYGTQVSYAQLLQQSTFSGWDFSNTWSISSGTAPPSLSSVTAANTATTPVLSYLSTTGTTGTVNQAMSVTPTYLNNNNGAITACGIKSGSANAGSFPGTLSVSASTCEISGTPTASLAATQFTLVASNSAGTSADALVTLTINNGVPSLSYSGATGTTGTVNQAMSVSPTTINGNGATITACGIKSGSANAASFPGTLSVNATTCVISGTPTATLAATQFTLVASNSAGTSADALVTLTINAAVPSLSYSGATGTTGTVNSLMSVSPTTLNANGTAITACGIKSGSPNAASFPGTLSVNASTCVISGTPTASLAATQFTLVAANSVGNSADALVTLTINNGIPTLSYTGATGTTGTVNQAMSVTPTSINGNGATITACGIKSGSANAGSFPGTLSVNVSTCVISGTPTASLAATQFTLVATNSVGNSADALVTLTISNGVPTLSYSGATGTTGTVNQAMSVSPTSINGNGASITACEIKSGSANAGSFPGTLSVNASTCVISGTPTATLAATQFTLVASNSAGTSADALVTLTINAGVPSLSYSGASGTTGTVNQAMSVTPTTINANGASITACGIKSGSANAGSFPGTLSVNASTCVISGTPTVSLAATQFTIVASNSAGTSADALVTLTIDNGVPSLSYSGASGTTGSIGYAMSVSPTTINGNGASITACGIKSGSANAASFPGTLSVNASTCVISGTPTATLSATQFTIVASNSAGTSGDALVTLTINAGVPSLSYSGASGTTGTGGTAMSVSPTTLNANGATITACGIKSGSANAASFPGTLSVNASTCVISGTPTATLAATQFTIVASNSVGTSTDALVTLTINAGVPSLSYSGSTGTTGTVGSAMSVTPTTLSANGASITACGIKSGSANAGSFPGTLSINASTCVVSGTPTATLAATTFTLVASNSAGTSADATVSLTINAGAPTLSYTGATGTTGTVNQAMSVSPTSLNANGATITACGIKSGSANEGSFPGTLSVNASTCVISGTPTAALAATQFTLIASNSAGTSADATVTLTINVGVPTLSYSGSTGTRVNKNSAMSVTPSTLTNNGASVTACGIKSGSANASSFPATLSINATTCVISGTPTTALTATQFTIVAANSSGNSSDALVTLAVDYSDPSTLSNLLTWYKANSVTGITSGDVISTWNDSSSSGLNLSSSGSNRPTYISDGPAGMPLVRFNGTSTYMLSGNTQLFTTTSSPLSTFIAFSTTTTATQRFLLTHNVAASFNNFELGYRTGGVATPNFGIHQGSSNASIAANSVSTSQWAIFSTLVQSSGSVPSNVSIYKNSTSQTVTQDGSGWLGPGSYRTDSAPLYVGVRNDLAGAGLGNYHSGDIAEIIVYRAAVSAADQKNIECYLSYKYGISISAACGTPDVRYIGSTGTTGTVNTAMSVTPTTLVNNGNLITACGIKSGSLNAGSFPGTLSINASTCVISGTPTATLSATQFTIVASNSAGTSADALVTLTINAGVPTLSYSGASGTTGTVNQAMSVSPTTLTNNGATITACGIKSGSANAASFPASLSVNASTCVISGTPTATLAGTQFTLVASNSVGQSADSLVTLTINAGVPSLSYSGATGTTGTAGSAMSVTPTTLTANGASVTACGIKSGSANAGSFPGTLTINAASCVISGTPTATLSATQFTIVASNSAGTSADALVTLTINAAVPSLSYSGASGTSGLINQAMSVSPTTLSANGASITACGIKSGSANAASFPGTLSVNATTCVISGTPTAILDPTQFTIVASNSVGTSSDALVTLTVSPLSTWAQEAYIKASNAQTTERFQTSAISRDTIVLGAKYENSNQTSITSGSSSSSDNSAAYAGAVYVYKRNGTTWAQEAYIKASNAEAGDSFGSSVAISDDTIAVGAYAEDSTQTTITNSSSAPPLNNAGVLNGAVYVYKRTGTTWAQESFIKPSNSDNYDLFGGFDGGISLSGDTLVVGASQESSNQTTISLGTTASADNSFLNSGAVYVFKRTGSTWAQEAYLKAPNAGANDKFGYSVSISGDTVAVGALNEGSNQTSITNGTTASSDNSAVSAGAVYVFKRTTPSAVAWAQEAFIKAPNAETGDWFGASVSISGDTLAVGAVEEDSNQTSITNGTSASSNNSASTAGAAYIFKRTGTTWAQQAYIKASNAEATDQFGIDVSIFEDTLIVGANRESSNQTSITNGPTASSNNSSFDSGAAYVFKRSGTSWTQEAYVKAPNADASDAFGTFVAIYGDTAVILAPSESSNQTSITNGTTASSNNSASEAGAAYVIKRSGLLNWTQQAYVKAPNAEANDYFGYSVAVSGDTAVVGAVNEDSNQTTITNGTSASSDNSTSSSGAAYVFKRTGTTWAQEAYLKAPNAEANDYFGLYVAVSGDTIVVGARYEDSNQTSITNGTTASSNNSAGDSGAVYVFKRTGTTWAQEAYLKAPNAEAGDAFGNSVSISDDTIAVGAFSEDSNQTSITNGTTASANNSLPDSGAVYIFKRSSWTWAQEAYIKPPNTGSSDNFGNSVGISGDTLIVGASNEASNQTSITNGTTASSDNSAMFAGAAYIFKRTSGSTWAQEAYLKAPNAEGSDQFGWSVAIFGDLAIVGAIGEDSDQTTITNGNTASSNNSLSASGAAYIFRRGAANWNQNAFLKPSNPSAGDAFGYSVSINRDTAVVGVPNKGTQTGTTYVFKRTGGTWAQEAAIQAANASAGSDFGYSVSVFGDTLIVGSEQEDSNQTSITNGKTASSNTSASSSGAAYIYIRQ